MDSHNDGLWMRTYTPDLKCVKLRKKVGSETRNSLDATEND
jgi:hypothetical protein